jgi:hypothetical protein
MKGIKVGKWELKNVPLSEDCNKIQISKNHKSILHTIIGTSRPPER